MSKGSERCLGGEAVSMHRRQIWQQEEIGDELAAAAVLFSVGITEEVRAEAFLSREASFFVEIFFRGRLTIGRQGGLYRCMNQYIGMQSLKA